MTESEENEEAGNSRRDGSLPIGSGSSRFKKLLDQISEDVNKTPVDLSANSYGSRFDSLLDQISEDRSDQSNESTDDQ